MARTPQVHRRIVESLLQLVESERSGEAVNRHLLKRTVDMLSALHLYEDGVQDALLAGAVQYYSREGAALISVSGLRLDPRQAGGAPAPRLLLCAAACAVLWPWGAGPSTLLVGSSRAARARRSWSWQHTWSTASGA